MRALGKDVRGEINEEEVAGLAGIEGEVSRE